MPTAVHRNLFRTSPKLLPLETRGKRLFPQKRDVIEGDCEGMPALPRRRFRSHDVRLGLHFHATAAERAVHQANLDFYRGSRLNPLGTEKRTPLELILVVRSDWPCVLAVRRCASTATAG